MDENRRIELYCQLRAILIELLYDKSPVMAPESDDSTLRIHASESIGTRERMVN